MSISALKLFFKFLSEICQSLPSRSINTFLELLIGAVLSSSGHVTDAFVQGNFRLHWSSYYKWLRCGSWSYKKVVSSYIKVVTRFLKVKGEKSLFISIDDTFVYRSSKKAPCAKYDFEHSAKNNRSRYVLAQNWVTAALTIFTKDKKPIAIPAISALAKKKGNITKIKIALELLKKVSDAITEDFRRVILVDAWFMKKTFIIPALNSGFTIIGQVRSDTYLYLAPKPKKKGRGRKRKYGKHITISEGLKNKKYTKEMHIYGGVNKVRFRSQVVYAKILEGRACKAVWCEIYNPKNGIWSKTKLIISTDHNMSAESILLEYSYRWPIESFFNQIKNNWGMKNAWQQAEKTLLRWFHINSIGYGLLSTINCYAKVNSKEILNYLPWRKIDHVTVGILKNYVGFYFSNFSIRDIWCPKLKKIIMPKTFGKEKMPKKAA